MHVIKNDTMPVKKALLIRLLSILAALVFVGILSMLLIKQNPFLIYEAMFDGIMLDTWTLLQSVSLLLIFGLAVIPAFQMKFWNLGANGQVLVGCLAAIACMKFIPVSHPEISNGLLITIMVCASIAASCIWSVIPAIFKAFFNTNETLFTLMMNYIALALVEYFVFKWDKGGFGSIGIVNLLNGQKGWFPAIADNQYLISIITALVLTVFMYIYIRYTKHGFEVQLVGESYNTAKYVGINIKVTIIRTLLLGGVICGILGALYAGSVSHTINTAVGGLGFTAILVAWLAGFNPFVMMFTSFFVVALDTGSKYVSTRFQLNSNDFASIVVGIIFFFVIGCEFFIRYQIRFNKKDRTSAERSAG
ncbi:MAG: ABC transporter permease [Clostridia bacterium]|nr:ABC transporter permease [Clostridia bacterium]